MKTYRSSDGVCGKPSCLNEDMAEGLKTFVLCETHIASRGRRVTIVTRTWLFLSVLNRIQCIL